MVEKGNYTLNILKNKKLFAHYQHINDLCQEEYYKPLGSGKIDSIERDDRL